MEDYIKTGEDKKFEYYRSDSEVLSEDGEEEPYEEILSKRDEFNIKVGDIKIVIRKRSLNKIMILSDSYPEEQILFSLYKTVKQGQSQDKTKIQANYSDTLRLQNPNDLDSLSGSKAVAFPNMISPENQDNNDEYKIGNNNKLKNDEVEHQNIGQGLSKSPEIENNQMTINVSDPLSGQMFASNNTNPNTNENVINIPSQEGSDNEDVTFKKTGKMDNTAILTLPTQAIRVKWFYLLLSLVGIAYVVLFIVGLINDAIGFMFNILGIFIIGVFLIFTGIFGFMKINQRIYDCSILKIFTYICSVLGIAGAILLFLNVATKSLFIVSLIFGLLAIIFSVLCIIWTLQLKKFAKSNKQKQMELLVDDK